MKKIIASYPTLWIVVLIAAMAIGLKVKSMLDARQGNWSAFALMGDHFDQPNLNDSDTVFVNSFGYDGQFFYQISFDPFLLTDAHKSLDSPHYRSQRLTYPLLVYLLSFGSDSIKPFMMSLINILVILMGVYFLGLWYQENGQTPFWALALAINGGVILSLARDLSEPVAIGFLVSGLWFYHHKKWVWSALLLSLAVLGREILIILPFILAIKAIIGMRWKPIVVSAVCGFVFLIWQYYVYLKVGHFPLEGGHGNFDGFLVGQFSYLKLISAEKLNTREWWFALVTSAFILFAVISAIRKNFLAHFEILLPLLLFAVMPLFFSDKIWVEPWSYGRVLLPLYALFLLADAQLPMRLNKVGVTLLGIGGFIMMYWVN